MEQLLSYSKNILQSLIRLGVSLAGATLLNLLLMQGGMMAWRVYGETHTGQYFAEINPQTHRQIEEVFALTPYWQTSFDLALAGLLGCLTVLSVLQVTGLLRLLYDPLPAFVRLLWPVALALLLASPYAAFDARLDSTMAYAYLSLPTMFCLLWPAMTAVRRLLPDLTMLFSAAASRR